MTDAQTRDYGDGRYVLVTFAYAALDGALRPLRVTHRFASEAARASFKKLTEEFHIFESEYEESNDGL
jgi:hypothetical protein